jgi:hypothetical protein
MMKTKDKKTFEVDIAVTLFITKEVEAEDADSAQSIAEHSIKTSTIIDAFQSGDCEIESHELREVE